MGYQLGIDLGTTYTAAAVHEDGRVEVVGLADRSMVIPSVVFVRPDGEVLAGEAANRRGVGEPQRAAREFKRRVGDPAPLIVGGAPYGAEVLTARLLRWVVDQVAERQGSYPERLALTHPANWGPYKLDLLRQAVEHAGFGGYPVTLLSEPEAAAVHYSTQQRVPEGAAVAVYDLGGGTFDAAVLRRTAGGFELLGRPQGIERFGGIDIDAAVLAHVDRAIGGAAAALDPDDGADVRAISRLRTDCVEAKEALSADTDAVVPVDLPGLEATTVRITRQELEALVRPALAETVGALRRAIETTGLEPPQLHGVLLVGGSSRMPLVAELLTGELGRPVVVDAHPKHVVAQGAAVAAARATQGAAATPTVVPSAEAAAPASAAGTPVAGQGSGPLVPGWGPTPAATAGSRPTGDRAGNRTRIVAVAGALALVAVVAGGVALAGRGGDDGDGRTAEPEPSTTTEAATGAFAPSDTGSVWVSNLSGGRLTLVDRESGAANAAVTVGEAISEAVETEEKVWTLLPESSVLRSYDRATGESIDVVELGLPASENAFVDVVATPTGVWVLHPGDGLQTVAVQVNTETGEPAEPVVIDELSAEGFVADGDAIVGLVADAVEDEARAVRIESDGSVSDPVALGTAVPGVDGVALASNAMWVLGEEAILRLDPATLEVTDTLPIDAVPESSGFQARGDDLWWFAVSDDERAVVGRLRAPDATVEEVEPTGDDLGTITPIAIPVGDDLALLPTSTEDEGEGAIDAVVTVSLAGDEPVVHAVAPGFLGVPPIVAAGDQMLIIDRDPATFSSIGRLIDADGDQRVANLEPQALLPANVEGALVVTDRRDGSIVAVDQSGTIGSEATEEFLGAPRVVGDEIWVAAGAANADEDIIRTYQFDLGAAPSITVPESTVPFVSEEGIFVGSTEVVRVDPETREVTPAFEVPEGSGMGVSDPRFLPLTAGTREVAGGAYWSLVDNGVARIDLATGEQRTCPTPAPTFDIETSAGLMWVTNDSGIVTVLDPVDCAQVATLDVGRLAVVRDVGGRPLAIELFGGAVHEILVEVDPDDPAPPTLGDATDVGEGPASFAVTGTTLWLAHESSRTFTILDNAGVLTVQGEPIELDGRPFGVASDEDGAWVVLQDRDEARRIGIDGTLDEPVSLSG